MKKTLPVLFLFSVAVLAVPAKPYDQKKTLSFSNRRGYSKPIEVVKKTYVNPTIYFEGIPARPELSEQIRNFLKICGWFELAQSKEKSDYQLRWDYSGGQQAFSLDIGGAPLGRWTVPAHPDSREVAKSIVDIVIERCFKDLKVRGFCHTKIAFCAQTASGVRNIFVCDIDGDKTTQVTRGRNICVEPCWTPGGKSICYSMYGKSKISILESTVPPRFSRILSSFSGINLGASVSPDGKKLAAILSFDHQVDLYVIDLRTRKMVRFTKNKAVEASPCWSPDGKSIAYVSDETGSPRIYTVDLNGRNRRRISGIPGGGEAVTPDWSSDNKILFSQRFGGGYTLGLHDLTTGQSKRIITEAGNWESPSWAPDNRQVVCKRIVGNKSELYVVDTRTGRIRPLLNASYNLFTPAWSPGIARK